MFAFPFVSHNDHDLFGGDQYLFKFDNGYGASVVRHQYSYGGEDGLFELAFIKWTNDDWNLIYTDEFADVVGWLTVDDVNNHLVQIEGYDTPKRV